MFCNKKDLFVIFFIPVIFFLYAIFTISDYGINWDEPYHFRRGQAFLQYFLTGNKTYEDMPKYPPLKGTSDSGDFRNSDKLFDEVQNNPALSDPNYRRSYYQDDAWNGEYFIDIESAYGHPALNGILASLTNYIFYQKLGILGDLEAYHLFIILMVSLMAFSMAIFMWRRYGLVESLISSLALTTYPLLLGEQHFNIKDPIEMAFYTITLISFYLGITKSNFGWLIASIISFGIALSVKFNIVFSIIPMGIWLIYYLSKNKPKPGLSKKIIYTLLLSPAIVFLILITPYPTIWKEPLQQLSEIARFYLNAGYLQSQPSNYYLFGFINTFPSLWIAATTPPATLLLFVLFFFFIKKLFQKDSFVLLLLLWFFTALLRISLFKALSYNGVRLIMEYIPPMAMLAGISAGYVYKKINNKLRAVVILIIFASFIPTIYKLVKIHPNENVYFNFLIGGLSGAKKINLNSWGNSYGNAYYQAVVWINNNAEANARLTLPVGLIGNIPRYKLRKDISLSYNYWSGQDHDGEYLLELIYDYPQMEWFSLKYLNNAMKPVYEVKVDGVAIAKVWRNDPEFVLSEYKNQKMIPAEISYNKKSGYIELSLSKPEKIMRVDLKQPITGCTALMTGYADTSIDGKTWIREIEDIARDQLKHSRLNDLGPNFSFYFVAKEAKYIRFHTEYLDSCLLNANSPFVLILNSD